LLVFLENGAFSQELLGLLPHGMTLAASVEQQVKRQIGAKGAIQGCVDPCIRSSNMGLFQDSAMGALRKIVEAHESEHQELLNEMFDISKRSEEIHRENLRLRQALEEIANAGDHYSIEEASRGEMGEYERGWRSCWKKLATRAQKALEP
jgi:hypothetical protein